MNNAVLMIDEAVLNQMVEDTSTEIFHKLINSFFEDAQNRLDSIAEAKANLDLAVLEHEVHTLGSSAGTFGAAKLHDAAREIEFMCMDKDPAAFGKVDGLLDLGCRSLTEISHHMC